MNISKEVEGGFLMSKRVYSLYCHVLHTVFYLTRQKRVTKGGGGVGCKGGEGVTGIPEPPYPCYALRVVKVRWART